MRRVKKMHFITKICPTSKYKQFSPRVTSFLSFQIHRFLRILLEVDKWILLNRGGEKCRSIVCVKILLMIKPDRMLDMFQHVR